MHQVGITGATIGMGVVIDEVSGNRWRTSSPGSVGLARPPGLCRWSSPSHSPPIWPSSL